MLHSVTNGAGMVQASPNPAKINKQEPPQSSELKNTKLESLSKQLANGEYKIDLEKLARKIADELI